MHGTYDSQADAAYLYLVDNIESGGSKHQILREGGGLKPMIVLDLDGNDRTIGIEIIGAKGSLHHDTLASLERRG